MTAQAPARNRNPEAPIPTIGDDASVARAGAASQDEALQARALLAGYPARFLHELTEDHPLYSTLLATNRRGSGRPSLSTIHSWVVKQPKPSRAVRLKEARQRYFDLYDPTQPWDAAHNYTLTLEAMGGWFRNQPPSKKTIEHWKRSLK